jgi:hypothetical protein
MNNRYGLLSRIFFSVMGWMVRCCGALFHANRCILKGLLERAMVYFGIE